MVHPNLSGKNLSNVPRAFSPKILIVPSFPSASNLSMDKRVAFETCVLTPPHRPRSEQMVRKELWSDSVFKPMVTSSSNWSSVQVSCGNAAKVTRAPNAFPPFKRVSVPFIFAAATIFIDDVIFSILVKDTIFCCRISAAKP